MNYSNEKIEVKFVVKKVRYTSEDSNFTILEVKFLEYNSAYLPTSELVVTGNFLSVFEGDKYEGIGTWINKSKFGYNFQLEEHKRIEPSSIADIKDFLVKFAKGIGKTTANKIVDLYGIETLSKIKEDHKNVSCIKGISEDKAKFIRAEILKHSTFENIALYCMSNGFSYGKASLIYEGLGDNAVMAMKENPYQMCLIKGISFREIDEYAINLGFKANNSNRVKFGLISYIQYEMVGKGHLYLPKDYIVNNLSEFLSNTTPTNLAPAEISSSISSLIEDKKLVVENNEEGTECVYVSYYNHLEKQIVKDLVRIMNDFKAPICATTDITSFIEQNEKCGLKFADAQKEAIYMAIQKGFSILTGYPGTGKTHTINNIIKCIKTVKPWASISLCAPTGKASKRMTEMTSMEAQTIHRLIKLDGFDETEEKELLPVEDDFLIIDESSMIDAYVFQKLLSMVSDNTRILCVGDFQQLPSVGVGSILADLINSKVIPTVSLTEIFRQSEASNIVINSHAIINGRKEDLVLDGSKKDFYHIERENKTQAQAVILKSIENLIINRGYSLTDIQVLCPMKKGDLGVEQLNVEIQNKFNPNGRGVKVGATKTYRVGDKVMQTENDYENEVFNGETGIVVDVQEGETKYDYTITVDFSGDGEKLVDFTLCNIDSLELAYAITIHKSQGSEYSCVLMPCHTSQEIMLTRNLIYTAISRAKSFLCLCGEISALYYAIDNVEQVKRYSNLSERLSKAFEN